MKGFGKKVVYWIPAVLWMGVIFYFSGLSDPMPGVEDQVVREFLGRAAHAGEYGVLTVFIVFGWSRGKMLTPNIEFKKVFCSAALALVYGITDELHQIFVPGRGFQVVDLAIDSLGAGMAAFAIIIQKNIFRNGGQNNDKKSEIFGAVK